MSATGWTPQGWQAPAGAPVAPTAPQAPPAWSAPTHPGPRTNLLALLAIGAAAAGTTIMLGIGSLAAIVLGAIALGQIRRTGDDGRLLAVWAIVLGAVTLVALTAATVIGIAGMVAIGQQVAELVP